MSKDSDTEIVRDLGTYHLSWVRSGDLEKESGLLETCKGDANLAGILGFTSTIGRKTGLMLAIENCAGLDAKEAQAMLTMLCEAEEEVIRKKGTAYIASTDNAGKNHWDYLLEHDEVPLALEIARGIFTDPPHRITYAPNSRRFSQTSMESEDVGVSR